MIHQNQFHQICTAVYSPGFYSLLGQCYQSISPDQYKMHCDRVNLLSLSSYDNYLHNYIMIRGLFIKKLNLDFCRYFLNLRRKSPAISTTTFELGKEKFPCAFSGWFENNLFSVSTSVIPNTMKTT